MCPLILTDLFSLCSYVDLLTFLLTYVIVYLFVCSLFLLICLFLFNVLNVGKSSPAAFTTFQIVNQY